MSILHQQFWLLSQSSCFASSEPSSASGQKKNKKGCASPEEGWPHRKYINGRGSSADTRHLYFLFGDNAEESVSCYRAERLVPNVRDRSQPERRAATSIDVVQRQHTPIPSPEAHGHLSPIPLRFGHYSFSSSLTLSISPPLRHLQKVIIRRTLQSRDGSWRCGLEMPQQGIRFVEK